MTDMAQLVADLQRDEGWRPFLYDDASGTPIKAGVIVRGHPTIGFGFALDIAPLTQAECLPILTGRATSAAQTLLHAAPWIADLSEPRQRALSNMAYNLGVTGLLKFDTFLGLMQQGKFDQAANDLEGTPWYQETGERALRIVALIRTG